MTEIVTFDKQLARELSQFRRTIKREIQRALYGGNLNLTPPPTPTLWGRTVNDVYDYPTSNKTTVYEVQLGYMAVREVGDADTLENHIEDTNVEAGPYDISFQPLDATNTVLAYFYEPCGLLPKDTVVKVQYVTDQYHITPLCRIAEARVTVGCTAATMTGTGTARRITTKTFKAELYEYEVETTGADLGEKKTPNKLKPSGVVVDVVHRLTKAMPGGAEVTIQLKPDGSWCLIVWSC